MTKRIHSLLIAITSAFALAQPAAADEMDRGYRHRQMHQGPHQRLALNADVGDRGCHTGWWQTLQFGHVRPRWGTSCDR